jgi:hypothetical protein
MTSLLTNNRYSLKHFPNQNQFDINNYLNDETINMINKLAALVGAPTYRKTPVFNKQRGQRPSRTRHVISGEDWAEIRNFKVTQLEKKEEGVDKDIDELRGILNKLTSKNYDTMKENIIQTLTTMFEKNCNEEDLEKIGESIFEIGSVNKFWSALYAKLYKAILDNFPLMKIICERNFKNFSSLFKEIRFISAEEDYDEFCRINKENEKRRGIASFFVHLMNNDVISQIEIYDLIYNLKEKMIDLIEDDDNKNEVEEFAENIVILIDGGKDILKNSEERDGFDWRECVEFIEDMVNMKVSEYPSLSNKVVFKFLDLEEDL